MARVIISSGHTSANPGSVANGLREADVARQIAKATLKYLRQNGVISLSIPPEMELLQRIDWINGTGYLARLNDLCVEIHVNDGGKSGIEAWFEGDGQNASQQLTELILNNACAESKLTSQGAKSEYKHEIGSIAFIHETAPVASLIECGYIDNPVDASFLKVPSNIDLLGKGIAKGICKFLNVEFRELPQATKPAQVQQPQKFTQPVNAAPAQQIVQPATQPAPPTTQAPAQNLSDQQVTSFNNNTGMVGASAPANTTSYGPAANNNNAFQPLPSREERKKMIIANYKKILGREPSQNDINYFLNIGIKEDELIKKMIDSQEHLDLVKAKQEFSSVKEKFDQQQAELNHLKTAMQDQTRIIEGLNYSIMQKNYALQNSPVGQTTGQLGVATQLTVSAGGKSKPAGYKGTFLDRLFKAFSDLFD